MLRNPDLQLVVEFNPGELRRAAPVAQPFFDRRLFSVLRSHFRHVFYMGRDKTLFEIRDYHELRRCLLGGGYFVDDLYCTNVIRPEIADLIVPRLPLPAGLPVVNESRPFGAVTYVNRDPDGWAMADLNGPPVTFISVDGPPSAAWVIKLYPVYKKHLHREGFVNWPVYALIGDVAVSVDVLDSYRELNIDYTDGAPPVLLESPWRRRRRTTWATPATPGRWVLRARSWASTRRSNVCGVRGIRGVHAVRGAAGPIFAPTEKPVRLQRPPPLDLRTPPTPAPPRRSETCASASTAPRAAARPSPRFRSGRRSRS